MKKKLKSIRKEIYTKEARLKGLNKIGGDKREIEELENDLYLLNQKNEMGNLFLKNKEYSKPYNISKYFNLRLYFEDGLKFIFSIKDEYKEDISLTNEYVGNILDALYSSIMKADEGSLSFYLGTVGEVNSQSELDGSIKSFIKFFNEVDEGKMFIGAIDGLIGSLL